MVLNIYMSFKYSLYTAANTGQTYRCQEYVVRNIGSRSELVVNR